MRTLLIECATRSVQIGLAVADRLVASRSLGSDRPASAGLLPAIRELLAGAGWRPSDVSRVTCTKGPGSFTGLRIGLVAAKTWTWATGAELVGVDTLEVLAHQAFEASAALGEEPLREILVVMRAPQRLCYTAWYGRDESGWPVRRGEPKLRPWEETLASRPEAAGLTGDALRWLDSSNRDAVGKRLGLGGVWIAPPMLWQPGLGSLAKLGQRRATQVGPDDPLTLVPTYLRPSYAEL